MDLLDLDRRALASTARFVEQTDSTQLSLPTPCEGWDVAALLNHVIGGNHLFAAAARTTTVDWAERDRNHLGNDHRAAYQSSCLAVTEAFAAPGSLDAQHPLPFGSLPGSTAVAIHFVDILVHGWDLATALNVDADLDPDLCEAALEIVALYPEESWGDPRFFDHRVDPPEGARPQDMLVATLGRQI